jgi:hypothetical protein
MSTYITNKHTRNNKKRIMIKERLRLIKKNIIEKKNSFKKRIHYLRSVTITFLFSPEKRVYIRRTSRDNNICDNSWKRNNIRRRHSNNQEV